MERDSIKLKIGGIPFRFKWEGTTALPEGAAAPAWVIGHSVHRQFFYPFEIYGEFITDSKHSHCISLTLSISLIKKGAVQARRQ